MLIIYCYLFASNACCVLTHYCFYKSKTSTIIFQIPPLFICFLIIAHAIKLSIDFNINKLVYEGKKYVQMKKKSNILIFIYFYCTKSNQNVTKSFLKFLFYRKKIYVLNIYTQIDFSLGKISFFLSITYNNICI